jgi:phosphoglycolate phosphatase
MKDKMPELKGLIFDLEGTLIDTAPDLCHALNVMLEKHGRRKVTADEVRSLFQEGYLTLMNNALEATGGAEPDHEMEYFREFISSFRESPPDPSQIKPNVAEILASYHKAGVKLGICTNRPTESAEELLRLLGLSIYFDFVAGGDRFEVHKPNPGHVTGVIEALGLAKKNCVMVGDGLKDLAAAHGAKVPFVLIGNGEDLDGKKPDAAMRDFSELPHLLKGLGF